MTPQQGEALVIIMEECAEVIQVCAKAMRFGLDSYHPDEPTHTNVNLLEMELGQVIAMIGVLQKLGIDLDADRMHRASLDKLGKLRKYSGLPSSCLEP